jgi:hypothetical protein
MTRARFAACASLLLLAAGCIDFIPVAGPGGEEDLSFYLFLTTGNAGPGVSPDSLQVDAFAELGSGRLGFSDRTLHVAGQPVEPVVHQSQWGYTAGLVLPPGTLREPLRIKLPVPQGAQLPVQEISVSAVARGGPDTLTVRQGADLVLPIGGGAHDPATAAEVWDVHVQRGFLSTQIRTTGPLPAQIVVPASLVPQDSAQIMDVRLISHRQLRWDTSGSTLRLDMQAALQWRVRLVP